MKRMRLQNFSKSTILFCILWLFSFSTHFYYFLQNRTFSQDQARDIMIADDLIDKGNLIIGYGPKASVGDFYLPPLYYYFQVIIRLAIPWPLAMGALITLVESFTPVVLFLIVKKVVDTRAGVIAAVLYAISPIVLDFATFMWNPNMIPFFTTFALWCVFQWHELKQTKWLILLSLAITVAIHLHYQTFVILPFYAGFLVWTCIQNRTSRKAWLVGGLIGIASFSPYVWQEVQNNWHNTQAIIQYFQTDHAQIYERVSKPGYILSFLPWFFGRVLLLNVPDKHMWAGEVISFGRVIFWVGGASIVGFFLSAFKTQSWKKYLKSGNAITTQRLLLLVYVSSVILALRLYKGDKIDYYLSTCFIFPPLFLTFLDKTIKMKVVNITVIAGIIFTAGMTFFTSTNISKNTLRDTQVFFQAIEQVVGREKVLIMPHHQDMQNIIKYGLRYESNLNVSELAPTYLAQVCYTEGTCFEFKDNLCQRYPELEQLGIAYDFPASQLTPVKEIKTEAYTVLVSKFDQ